MTGGRKEKEEKVKKPKCPFGKGDGFGFERDYEDVFNHRTGHDTRNLPSVTVYYGEADHEKFTIDEISNEQAEWLCAALNAYASRDLKSKRPE